MSGPGGSASPIVVTLDGRTHPSDALDPDRDPAAPRVVLRPANDSAPPSAGIDLDYGGYGVVSGRVTLRGLGVAGFGPRDGGGGPGSGAAAGGGGVVAVRISPSLTIAEGCTFSGNAPAAVSVIGGGGDADGQVVVDRAKMLSSPLAVVGSASVAGVSVAATFHGGLSVSATSIAGGSYGIRVESADARVALTNVSVQNATQVGLDMPRPGPSSWVG